VAHPRPAHPTRTANLQPGGAGAAPAPQADGGAASMVVTQPVIQPARPIGRDFFRVDWKKLELWVISILRNQASRP